MSAKKLPGKLVLKGGVQLPIEKKQRSTNSHRAERADAAEEAAEAGTGAAAGGIGGEVGKAPSLSYEELFPAEQRHLAAARGRTTAWGTNYRAAPEVLHGYSARLSGPLSAEQKLDVRSAAKADKFCK